MLVHCLYRYTIDSPIIEGLIDTKTGVIEGLAEDLFKAPVDRVKWFGGNKAEYGEMGKDILEEVMIHSKTAIAIIEYGGIGYLLVEKNHMLMFLKVVKGVNMDIFIPKGMIFDRDKYKAIGYTPNIVSQYNTSPKYPDLLYNESKRTLMLADGTERTIAFDLNEIGSQSLSGYMSLDATKHVGMVSINGDSYPLYLKGNYVYVDKANPL